MTLWPRAPAAQWLTWLFQIMPVSYIVGGSANAASWAAARRDGRTYGAWLGSGLARLRRPVLCNPAKADTRSG